MSSDLVSYMESVARELLGNPNLRQSTKRVLRFGTNGSLEVNIDRGIWKDHEHGDGGGVLGLVSRETGRDERGAWEWLAEHGYVTDSGRSYGSNGASRPRPKPNGGGNGAAEHAPPQHGPEIVATYDFHDVEGDVRYQEVRTQYRLPDGSWELTALGKPKKSIKQRRPVKNGWEWNLNGVTPLLYDLPALRVEMLEKEDDRRIVFLPEGPQKCEALKEWGLLATTNSGGAKNWTAELAAELHGADVVVMVDNDDAGRAREQTVCKSLIGVAKRIRVLDWGKAWSDCPPKGDNVDWQKAGGTKERLLEIVDKLADWSPEPFKSAFGAVTWSEVRFNPTSYAFLINGLLPANERTMIFGHPSSGKSFIAQDMGLSIARGVPYEGRRVRRMGVIYCACEGGKGFVNRAEGYRLLHNLSVNDGTPFTMLTRPFDLFADTDGITRLRAEIEHWASTFSVPLGLIVLDTVSASGGAMDDAKGNEVARYLANSRALLEGLDCAALFVHHVPKGTPATPTPRGSGKWTGDLEATIKVDYEASGLEDQDGRPIRIVRLVKLREGEGNKDIKRFVLRQIEIGRNEFGDVVTTCVVVAPGPTAAQAATRNKLYSPSPNEKKVFRALLDALAKHGEPPPPDSGVPSIVEKVVTGTQLLEAYLGLDVPRDDVDEATRLATARQALTRAGTNLMVKPLVKVIGKQECGRTALYWWTGAPLSGFAETFPKPKIVSQEPQQQSDVLDQIGDEDF